MLRWVTPNKVVDLFWGKGWNNHARFKVIRQGRNVHLALVSGANAPTNAKMALLEKLSDEESEGA